MATPDPWGKWMEVDAVDWSRPLGEGNSTNMSDDWGTYDDNFSLDFPETAAAEVITLYISPLWLLCGTLGNIVTFIVMRRLSRYILSTCLYLAVISILDLIVLYARCGNDWMRAAAAIDISNMLMMNSESICKVYPFVFNCAFHMCRWLLVSAAIEGAICTWRPHRVIKVCTVSRAEAVMLLLTVLLICVNIHYFWSFDLVPSNIQWQEGRMCTFTRHGHQHSELFQTRIWPVMDVLVAEVLPYSSVTICTVVMVVCVIRGRHRGDVEHQSWRERYQIDPVATDQLKLTILGVSIAFLLFTVPKFSYLIVKYKMDASDDFSFEADARLTLMHAVTSMAEYMFLSLKFVLYFICSARFRQEALRLVRCRCYNKVHQPDDLAHKPMMEHVTASASPPPRQRYMY